MYINKNKMKDITNELKQLIISGILGDGSLDKRGNGSVSYNCIYKEYIEYKMKLAGKYAGILGEAINKGFKSAPIYSFKLKANPYGKTFVGAPLEEVIKDLDELGLAMWLYDDGSLHKTNHFYNLNTHSFPYEVQRDILIPLLNRFNIYPSLMKERKKDGREFDYLYIGKWNGALEVNDLLKKYPLECYKYKTFDVNYIDTYDKVRDRFKGAKITSYMMSSICGTPGDKVEEKLNNLVINKKGFVVISGRPGVTFEKYIQL